MSCGAMGWVKLDCLCGGWAIAYPDPAITLWLKDGDLQGLRVVLLPAGFWGARVRKEAMQKLTVPTLDGMGAANYHNG